MPFFALSLWFLRFVTPRSSRNWQCASGVGFGCLWGWYGLFSFSFWLSLFVSFIFWFFLSFGSSCHPFCSSCRSLFGFYRSVVDSFPSLFLCHFIFSSCFFLCSRFSFFSSLSLAPPGFPLVPSSSCSPSGSSCWSSSSCLLLGSHCYPFLVSCVCTSGVCLFFVFA